MKTIDVIQYGVKTKAVEKDTYIVAEWFANKAFIEFNKKYGYKYEGFDNRIFAIIGETEKAYNVIIGTPFNHVATWCPKILISVDKEPNKNDITLVCDFSTAMEVCKSAKEFY
jgi:hypothetical protein